MATACRECQSASSWGQACTRSVNSLAACGTRSGRIIVAGRYDLARAQAILAAGHADLVGFGRPFIANPDLPRRLHENLPLAQFDPATLFGGDAQGYSTYPAWETAA